MEKLELKHLAGYLPYKLNVKITGEPLKGEIHKLTGINYNGLASLGNGGMFGFIQRSFDSFKPILRPLSDLTKEIEVNGEKFVPIKKLGFTEENISDFNISFCPYWIIKLLYEWHFDIHGGIGKWAIDINTLK